MVSGALQRGRVAFGEQRWQAALEELSAADSAAPLSSEDLERLAFAAYLVSDESAAAAAWKRAHQQLLDEKRPNRAARWGFWLALTSLLGGKAAEASGWLSRTQRLIGDREDCVERGYLEMLQGLMAMIKGRTTEAAEILDRAISSAQRFDEADLMALSLLGRGQLLIQSQQIDPGVALLDEAMVAATSGAASPIVVGIIYCAVILTCQSIFDLERSREWTNALDEWCAKQPELVAYRGVCLVHRSEVCQLDGRWPRAVENADRACRWYADRGLPTAGRALYQRAELHRLQGDYARAEDYYRQAAASGYEPEPGASLLRLAQGDSRAAKAALARVVREASDRPGPGARPSRARVLGPYVEILIAVGELDTARTAAEELEQIASQIGAPLLRAASKQAKGAVLLAEGNADQALSALREAWTTWQQLETPYEAARVRVLIGRACEALGDCDTGRMHVDAARALFARLGARPDVERLAAPNSSTNTPLSQRETEVLTLVAAGLTNKRIAASLSISEHTVARHLSNIFTKLGVTTRTAASAYAHERGLLDARY